MGMSSLVAVLSKAAPADISLVEKMLAAAPHRGTDLCVTTFGSCAIGVGNDSETIDGTISRGDRLLAAFVGNLDNAVELRTRLIELGHALPSRKPADLLVAAFEVFGPDAPKYFRGAFSGVVTNGTDLWIFRDHIGLQTLFFRDEPKAFFVATEAKQIIAGTGILKEPNTEVLELLFYSRLTHQTPPALKGIERLTKTTVLGVGPTGVSKPHQYWDPTKLLETSALSAAELGEAFSHVFCKAISRVLTGRDAISLSGGIDSPAVAAHAAPLHRELMGHAIGALSTVYPQHPRVDERRYIELIAKSLHIDLHTFTPEAAPWDDVAHWCALFDGPINMVSLPAHTEFFKLARHLGFTSVFTGDVAEAVFDLNWQVTAHLLTRRRWKALWTRIRTLRQHGEGIDGVGRSLIAPFVPGNVINWYLRQRRDLSTIPHWLDATMVNKNPLRRDLLPRGRDRWVRLQLRPFLEGASWSLEAQQVCGSLCGVTVRRPFADIDVCEFFLSLPAELKYPDQKPKTLMRRMLRGKLPDEILDRRDKTVFDDFIMAKLDYGTLKRYLTNPSFRIRGVDYEALGRRIDKQDFKLIDYAWVNDLVRIHAFLTLW
jgi:asparagine synthase (glutamine-hydrolysing)